MNNKTLIQLARLACGTALLIAKMVTGADGTLTIISLVLMGVPFEAISKKGARARKKGEME